MTASSAIPVTEVSQVGEARRVATTLASRLDFDETQRGQVAIVVTEIATNLVKHARDGELILRSVRRGDVPGIEILGIDRGPGIADISRCLADGYSTAGSPGNGLGAIARLAESFGIHSVPGLGTSLFARFWAEPRPRDEKPPDFEVGAVCLPKSGEVECGDLWSVVERDGTVLAMVADGLGHGPLAAVASREAVRIFEEHVGTEPVAILTAIHGGLRPTRGAVVAVAALDRDRTRIGFAGVGNISACVISPTGSRSMVSHNGTVGHEARKIQEFPYAYAPGDLLVMHSDGLNTHWSLDRYPGLSTCDPALIAGVLYRDACRGRDDATVVVVRAARGEGRA